MPGRKLPPVRSDERQLAHDGSATSKLFVPNTTTQSSYHRTNEALHLGFVGGSGGPGGRMPPDTAPLMVRCPPLERLNQQEAGEAGVPGTYK